jgi:MFS family permease
MVNYLATNAVRASAQTLLVLAGSGLGPLITNLVVGLLVGEGEGGLKWVFVFAAVLAFLAGVVIFLRGEKFEIADREKLRS